MMMPWVIQQKATNFRVTYGKGNLSNACPADTVNWILNMCDIASLTVSIGICALLPNYFTINQVLALCHQPVALWRDFPGISKLFGFRKFLLFRKGDQVPLFMANRCQNSDLHHSNWNNPLNVTKDSDFTLRLFFSAQVQKDKDKENCCSTSLTVKFITKTNKVP